MTRKSEKRAMMVTERGSVAMEFILVSAETACTQTHYTGQTPTSACTASLIHELNRVPNVQQSTLGSRYFFMVKNQRHPVDTFGQRVSMQPGVSEQPDDFLWL